MKTKLILEIGCNHQGDMDLAKRMIQEAAEIGAYGVKFQKRDIDSIPEDVGNIPRDMKTSFGKNYIEHRKALELDIWKLDRLRCYAESMNLNFSCSAFDVASLRELVKNGIMNIKLPSQLFSSHEMRGEILTLSHHYPINLFLSTGMHTGEEIALSPWFDIKNIKIVCVYHCMSVYPCFMDEINLSTVHMISRFAPAGYSSHDVNGDAIPWAVAAGARYIERHFTMDKSMKGSDHGTVSSDPAELRNIVHAIKNVENMMGDMERELSDSEKKIADRYRGPHA